MKYLYLLFITLGIVLFFFAAQQYLYSQSLLKNGIKTEALVIEMITVSDSDGDTYKPVFEYYDQNKVKRVYISYFSSNPPSYEIGDKEKIVFNPENPEEVKIISFVGLYLIPLLLLIPALSLFFVGLYFLIKLRKQNKVVIEDTYIK